jgi:hypothetical protein
MSDTPETDALLEPLRGSCAFNGPCAEHARRLERERDQLRADIAELLREPPLKIPLTTTP